MTDTFSPDERSFIMSRVQNKNTKPENMVRKYLFSQGFRYRKNVDSLPGHPDIVLPKYKTVIFVNGCFWHMHDCGRFRWPDANSEYWKNKIYRNVERDAANQKKLQEEGWKVLTVWECQLKKKVFKDTMDHLVQAIIN